MKVYLALVVAVIGVGMAAADENLKSKLQMALKSMIDDNEELQMGNRDTKGQCDLATNSCNNHGTCIEDRWGTYYCRCVMPYRVGGSDSSCYLPAEKKEDLQMENRDTKGQCDLATNSCNNHGTCIEDRWGSYYCRCVMPYRVGGSDSSCYLPTEKKEDLEMETRDSLARCGTETNQCDGHGECRQSSFGRNDGQYICFCEVGYRTNSYGGCSPTTAREVEYLSNIARDVELEMLTRDTLRRCNLDTNKCDGFGQCKKSTFGRSTGQYICLCEAGFTNNLYGGCSPRTNREIEYLAMLSRDVQLSMLARKSFSECNQDTNDCDGYGECVEDTHGEYLCVCREDYENNLYGGCSPTVKHAEEDDTDVAGRKKEIMRQLAELLEEE